MAKGRKDLCESILLSTKDVVDGKTLEELVAHLNIPDNPALQSLTNYETRIWYKTKKGNIGNVIDKSKSLQNQAKEAFELRNKYRTDARQYMKDRNLAEYLAKNEVNEVWEDFVKRTTSKMGKSVPDDEVWQEIINKSMKGREQVDELFKLDAL